MYKELEENLRGARQGCRDSKEKVLDSLYPLIIASIKRYYNRPMDYDDLLQEGRLVVLESVESYDPDKGVYFLGYVKLMLKYHYLNKHKERKHLSLNEVVSDENQDEMVDMLESEDLPIMDLLVRNEGSKELLAAILQLPDRQRDVVIDFYIDRLAIAEIAKKYNITYRTVVNNKAKGLASLRRMLC